MITTKMKNSYREQFTQIYQKLFAQTDQNDLKMLPIEEQRNYENIIMTVSQKEIMSWIEKETKQTKIQEEMEKELKKKTGYFGSWFGGDQTSVISDEEQSKIESFVQDIFEEESDVVFNIPDNYSKFKIKFIQKKFKINLSKEDTFENLKELITIQTKQLELEVYIKKNGMKLLTCLESFKINYTKNDLADTLLSQQQIIFCDQSDKDVKFFQLVIEDKPIEQKGLDKLIKANIGSINFVVNMQMINTLTDIFKFDTVSDDLTDMIKSNAKKKIRQAKDIGENVMKNFLNEQPKFLVLLEIKTPQIILPVDYDNDKSTPCWIFHPGNLTIRGDTFTNNSKEKEMYDLYSIALQNIKMLYCQNIQIVLDKQFSASQIQSKNFEENFFAIFKDFNINIDINTLKKIFVDLNCIDARIKVNAQLNSFKVNLTPEILGKLKAITNIFIVQNTNLKRQEKKEVLSNSDKANYINVKLQDTIEFYFCTIYKNFVYIYEDGKNDQRPLQIIDLKETQLKFQTAQQIIEFQEGESHPIQLCFDEFKSYESWENLLLKKMDQIEKRKRMFEEEEDQADSQEEEGEEEAEQNDEIKNLEINFRFEDLTVFIKTKNIEYELSTKNLLLNLIQTSKKLETEIELQNFTLLYKEDEINDYLITSFYEQSMSSQILKSNYIQKQEKLIIIKYSQQIQDDTEIKQADISFGSVFFDIEPLKLKKLMELVLGEQEDQTLQSHNAQQSILLSGQKYDREHVISEKVLDIFKNNSNKLDDPEKQPVEMYVNLEIQAINVLLINQINDIPMADLIIKDSSIKVQMKKGAMNVITEFKDLVVYDLTNYPNTLEKQDIPAIVPRMIFGKLIEDQSEQNTLIYVDFRMKDPQIYNIDESLIANQMKVSIQKVNINFHMQVIMRILSFLTDQLLPALANESSQQESEEVQRKKSMQMRFDIIKKRNAFISIFKPFWSKMNVEINDTQCNFKISENDFIQTYMANFSLENFRTCNKSRLIKFDKKNSPYEINGIWNDNYVMQIKGLDCILFQKELQKSLTTKLNMDLDVQMALFDLEYSLLFNMIPISNYQNKYLTISADEMDEEKELIFEQDIVYIDQTMLVNSVLHPFLLKIGNNEYNALMSMLDNCITHDDGKEKIYIKDWVKKEEQKKPMGMFIDLTLENIALVTMDNKKDDQVYSKIFVSNSNLNMLMDPDGSSYMDMKMENFKGYYLLEKDNKYYEKGFLGDLVINKVYEPKDNKELEDLFIKDLVEKDWSSEIQFQKSKEKKYCFGFNMNNSPNKREINLNVQGLKILCQFDVLLQLASLTSRQEQVDQQQEQKEVEKQGDQEKVELQEEETPLMVVKINIQDNFFLLPSIDYEYCLVVKGDLEIDVTMFPQQKNRYLNKEMFDNMRDQFRTNSTRMIKKEDEQKDPQMKVDLKMKNIQIFLSSFIELLVSHIDEIPKRQLLLPFNLEVNFEQIVFYQQHRIIEHKITNNKINVLGTKIEFKIADKDIDLLLGIMNYSLMQLNTEEEKNQEQKIEEDRKKKLSKEFWGDNVIPKYVEMTYNYISLNIVDHVLFTLVHEYDQIFAPTFVIKLKNIKILSDLEETIKVVIAFAIQMDYFNSDIFKWEPFVEKSVLRLEYSTMVENGVVGKHIKFVNADQTKMNINVTIPLLKKIKFLMDTFDQMKQINEQKKKEISKLESNFEAIKKENLLEKKKELEQMIKPKTFISPIKVTNNTGYNVELTYYKKIIIITDDSMPQMKNIKNKKIIIQNNESTALNIEENIDDINTDDQSKTKTTETFSYKFVSFLIQHKDFTINKISSLNLEQNFSKKITLHGKQKNISQFQVLYNSKNVKDLKDIMLTSPVQFENKLGKSITLAIKHPFEAKNFVIETNKDLYIPFDLIGYLAFFEIEKQNFPFKHKKIHSLTLKEAGYATIMTNTHKTFSFVLKVYRDPTFYYLTKIIALPAIYFKNSLPVPITLTLMNQKEERKFELDKEEDIQISDIDLSVIIQYKVKIPGFQESVSLPLLENKHLKYEKLIKLKDYEEQETYFNIVRLRDGYCHFNFAIYSDVVIINETCFEFDYEVQDLKGKKKYIVAGTENPKNEEGYNKKIAYLSSQRKNMTLKIKNNKDYQAEKFSNCVNLQGLITGVFHNEIYNIEGEQKQYFIEVGYNSKLVYVDPNDFIATKVIHLTPKTILFNKTKFDIELLSQSKLRDVVLKSENKKPVYIYDYDSKKHKYLDIQVKDESKRFKNLSPIDLNKAGSSYFMLLDQSENMKVFRIEILIEMDYVVVNFLDRTNENDLVFINSTNNNVSIYQKNYDQFWKKKLKKGEQLEVGFVNPYGLQHLVAYILDEDDNQIDFVYLRIEKLNKNKHDCYDKKAKRKFTIKSKFYLENEHRYLEIFEENKEAEKQIKLKTQEELTLNQQRNSDFTNIDINIRQFGISLVAKSYNQMVEMFYLYIDDIRFIGLLAEDQIEIQLGINYINIDNNYSALSKFPVLLTTKQSLKKIKKHQNKFFNFHLILNQSSSENLKDIDTFELEITPLIITTEFQLLNAVFALSNQLQEVFSQDQYSVYLDKYFKNEKMMITKSLIQYNDVVEWEIIKFRSSNMWIYCKTFKVSQIKVILTFGMNQYNDNENKEHQEDINFGMLINTIGVTFLNIDESPISITGLKLESVFESQEGLTNIILTHLKDQNRKNLAKIVGNLDIIGNPVSLFSNVGNGVVEFFEKPVDGFVKGPIEGFVGIGKGTSSLIKSTAAGAFNAVSKVTNSLASGLTSLSMDSKYLKQRNLDKAKKPQNLFEGMGRGAMSIGKGIVSGITGVFSKPVTEIKKSGASGIFKGLIKGFGGLIVKPIGGIFDAVSQTAEGFKKTVLLFDDKQNEKKQRIPRVFYGSYRFIKVYNDVDAQILKSLQVLEHKRFENDTFLEAIKIQAEKSSDYFIVLTYEHFIILNGKMKKITMYCEIKDISKLRCLDPTTLSLKYFSNGNFCEFTIKNKESKILKLISSINYARYIHFTSIAHH